MFNSLCHPLSVQVIYVSPPSAQSSLQHPYLTSSYTANMATAGRAASRALRSTSAISSFRNLATERLITSSGQGFSQQSERGFASSTPKTTPANASYVLGGFAVALLSGAGYFGITHSPAHAEQPPIQPSKGSGASVPTKGFQTQTLADYQAVYDAIAQKLIDEDEYDDGSYGPVVLRLGWHSSGTYDAETGTGGSNGATMRFDPEGEHAANSGLKHARDFLESIKDQFPWITYSDLWTLAAVCAVQELGGPIIPWRPGRSDREIAYCTPDGRLPDGAKGQGHLRAIFGRMGLNDREIVALSGAHALGRCHVDRSGFDGPWTFSPTMLTNDFYKLLIEEHWHYREWDGKKQWQDDTTKSLMMLPSDMALVEDDEFRLYVEKYAADQDLFFDDFREAVVKLFELGVPFQSSEKDRMEFARSE